MKRVAVALGLLVVCLATFWLWMGRTGPRGFAVSADSAASAVTSSGVAQVPSEPSADPRAVVASEASPPSDATVRDALQIVVRDPLTAPVADALIVLFRADTVFGALRTNSDGEARFDAPGGMGEWLLIADGWAIGRGELDLSPGERAITLADDASIEGRVLIDGEVPGKALDLAWNTSAGLRVPVDWYVIPVPVRKAAFEAHARGSTLHTQTRADGSFSFRGLPQDMCGSISWGGALFLEGRGDSFPERSFNVDVPRSDLLLRLVSGVELRLRVVDDDGAPVKGALGRVEFLAPDGSTRSTLKPIADRQGMIVYDMLRSSLVPIRVTLARTNCAPPRSHEFAAPSEIADVWDLGDVSIPSTREISVHVNDEQGKPILDARATAWIDRTLQMGAKQTHTGELKLAVAASPCTISAQAFGYVSSIVEVPAEATEVSAVLSAACVLEFRTRSLYAEEFSLELSGPTPLFVDEDQRVAACLRYGGGFWPVEQAGGYSTLILDRANSGMWRFAALAAGKPLRARVMLADLEVCAVDVAALAPAEQRVVMLPIERALRTLQLRVLDRSGKPIAGARVYRSAEFAQPYLISIGATNEAGEFHWQSVNNGGTFLIRTPRHSPKWLTLSQLPEDPVDIVLDDGLTLEVDLVHADGTPFLDDAMLSVEPPLVVEPALRIGPARFTLAGLPAEVGAEIVLRLESGSHTLLRLVDTSAGYVRMVIGDPGKIVVRIAGLQDDESPCWRVALAPAGNARGTARARLEPEPAGDCRASLDDLALGAYDIWLERWTRQEPDKWTRVGPTGRVVLDEARPAAALEIRAP